MVLPLLALVLAFTLTREEVAIPPRLPVLLGTAVLFTLLAGRGGRRPRPWIDLPLAAVLGLAAGHLLFAPGLPFGHDTIAHLWGSWAAFREIHAGDLFPRWLHHLGMGEPLLQFYGPVGFYAMLPFSLAGLESARVLSAGFLALGALAAVAMYAAVARWTGDRRAGLVAAAAYAFAPYRLLDSNYRMALGESAALALLPLVLFGAAEVARRGERRGLAFAAVATALLIAAHPLTSLMAVCALGLWLGAEAFPWRPESWTTLRARALRLGAVWALGGLLAGFYVLPFAAELRSTRLSGYATGTESTRFALHGLSPGDLLLRRQWSRIYLSEPRGSTEKEMPFYFGWVLLALVPFAAGAGRVTAEEPSGEERRLPKGLLAATLGTLLLSIHPLAAAAEFLFPPLTSLYFPWRFLSIASCGAAAAAGFAAARLLAAWQTRRWATWAVPGALVALLLLDAAPYTGAPDWLPPYQGFGYLRHQPGCGERWGCWEHIEISRPYPLRAAGYVLPPPDLAPDVSLFHWVYPEYATPTTYQAFFQGMEPQRLARAGVGLIARPGWPVERLRARPYAVWKAASPGAPARARPFERGTGAIRVLHNGRPGRVTVLEQYFPGWHVWTPAGWREVRPTADGLLQAEVSAGQRDVRFRFQEARWDRTAGWILSASAALILLGLLTGVPWARPKGDPPPGRG